MRRIRLRVTHPLAIIVVAGVMLRLLVGRLYPGHWYDVFAFQDWTRQLLQNPLHEFYFGQVDVQPDHLPGDLWLLWLVGQAAHLFVPNVDFYGTPFAHLLRLTAIGCDVALIISAWWSMRALDGRRAGVLAAATISFNPVVIFISSVWTQFDALSVALALLAVRMLARGRPLWASGLFIYACLIKPQLGLLVPVLIIMELRRRQGGRPLAWSDLPPGLANAARDVVLGGFVAVAVALATCLPFGVGLLGMATPWTVLERVRMAADTYQWTVLGAWNVWTVPIGRATPPDDVTVLLAGVSYQDLGVALTLLGVLGGVWIAARLRPLPGAVLCGGFVTLWSFFLFATRVHERYLLPALLLGTLAALLAPALRWWAAALTATCTLNLVVAYAWHVEHIGPLSTSSLSQAGSVVNIALFAGFLLLLGRSVWTPRRGSAGDRVWPGATLGADGPPAAD